MKINFFTVNEKKYPPRLQKIEYRSPLDDSPDWCFYLPPDRASSVCMVVLHGFGGSGSQLYLRPSLRRHCLPEYLKRNYHILTPNLRGDSWMNPAAMADLNALLEFLRQRLGIRTVILDSGSMGGFSNLVFACLNPGQIQGVIARGTVGDLAEYCRFCGEHSHPDGLLPEILQSIHRSYGGSPEDHPALYRRHSPCFQYGNLRDLPVYLAHGSRDQLMPVEDSRQLAGLCAAFPRFMYHEIQDGDHESPLNLTGAPLDWIGQFLPPDSQTEA